MRKMIKNIVNLSSKTRVKGAIIGLSENWKYDAPSIYKFPVVMFYVTAVEIYVTGGHMRYGRENWVTVTAGTFSLLQRLLR